MRTMVATGITDGVGLAVMRGLFAKEPFKAVLIGRNESKLLRLRQKMVTLSPESIIYTEVCDLASVRETEQVANKLKTELQSLDILFQSAGTIPSKLKLTPEGIEESLAVSYICRSHLYYELKPLLQSSVDGLAFHVASPAQNGEVNISDLNLGRKFSPMKAVRQFQQLNDALALEESSIRGLQVLSYSPGITRTGIHQGGPPVMRFVITKVLGGFMMREPEVAARVPVAVILSNNSEHLGPLINPHGKTIHPARRLNDPLYRRDVLSAGVELTNRVVRKA